MDDQQTQPARREARSLDRIVGRFSEQMLDRPRTIADLAAEAGTSEAAARRWVKSLPRVSEGLTRPRIYWIREVEDAALNRKQNTACPHDWRKVSLVTHEDGYDVMECRVCGVRGKRHGIGRGVIADSPNVESSPATAGGKEHDEH